MATQFLSEKNELDMELALSAVAGFPTLEQASDYLKEAHGITVSPAKLAVHRGKEPEKYEKLREQLAPKLEGILAADALDIARLAATVEQTALERTLAMLQAGEVREPSKVARDIADVKSKNIDKRLALQGRPTEIKETRSVDEITRALEGLGVVKRVDATTSAEEA